MLVVNQCVMKFLNVNQETVGTGA
ncbi:hypothetical protein D299_gp085 [Escherichia phage HX01]|nr:hypothetical protein D299_gp085 [Escherichia phage HX01]